MATCEHPSQLLGHIARPSPERGGVDADRPLKVLIGKDPKSTAARSNLQEGELGDIFYWVDSRPRNPWAMAASYISLALLLLFLVLSSLLHIDPLPTMQRVTMLYLPTRAAAAGNGVQIHAPKPVPVTNVKSVVVPTRVHQAQEVPLRRADTTAGVVGGIPGGVVGGTPDGVLSDVLAGAGSVPVPAKAPEPKPAKRIRIASQVAEANLIHDVPPQYPPEAGRERIEGTVVLMAVIGKDGSVEEVQVVSGLPLLAQAAIEAVKQWRYKPYLLNGDPTEIDSRITINFTLSRG